MSSSIVSLINQIASINAKKNPTLSSRYNLFPPSDYESFEFFKKQEAAVWTASELDFTRDRDDFQSLEPEEREMLKTVLGFFAPADGLISENLIFRFLMETETYEEKSMFIVQLFIEMVHAETYGTTIQTLITDEKERNELFNAVNNNDAIKAKAEWMEKYLLADLPKAERLLAFSCAEGIFFCSLFMFIFWFRSRGILQNVIFSNELINRDEQLHRDYGCMLFRRYRNVDGITQEKVIEIVTSAVDVEMKFINYILKKNVKELTYTNASQFVKNVADNLLGQCGYDSYYNVKSPYTWMNDLGLQQKGNFYEVRIGSYKKFSVENATDWNKRLGLKSNTINTDDKQFDTNADLDDDLTNVDF
jgi:ribonucleoside-diphosphate reductase subunit M2